MQLIIGILIPFLGTTLGASMVFFMKNTLNTKLEKILLGFAIGVMFAASIWSLLIPSIELADGNKFTSCIPAIVGFVLGFLFLMQADKITSNFENSNTLNKPHSQDKTNLYQKTLKKNFLLILAITLHNIPEGICQIR